MSRYSGTQPTGAARAVRAIKHDQAVERSTRTLQERTAKYRRDRATIRAVVDALAEPATPGGNA